MKYVISVLVLFLLAGGCTKIDYVGEEYGPVQKVDVYYSADDIERPYRTIGYISGSSGSWLRTTKGIVSKIVARGKEVGADAVIFGPPSRTYDMAISSDDEGRVSSHKTSSKNVSAVFIQYE